MKHRTPPARGHMLSIVLSAIVAVLFVWWLLSPVAQALAGALQQLGNALGAKP